MGGAAHGQSYTSYFSGDPTDAQTTPTGGVCLMGGSTEDDNAMTWFLQQANGGDVLVLRASGSDGYNDYMYTQLGVAVNSVETIVFDSASAATEPYIHQKIQQAEAIWFAGGDQWNYISYWRDNAIDSLINDAISSRKIAIGGTSAGMAILGKYYFSAENGTVTSNTALSNPYDNNVTVASEDFIATPYLKDVITDTHYDDPDRKGRHVTFLARILVDYGEEAKGIACDEFTAVCIDANGMASVYGGHPSFDDNAYFIQTNCGLANVLPENCSANNPLDWNLGNEALKVYKIKGTASGGNTFDLTDWETGNGGVWEHWYVDNGTFNEAPGTAPNCLAASIATPLASSEYKMYPNPAAEMVTIEFTSTENLPESIRIVNQLGQLQKEVQVVISERITIALDELPAGIYLVEQVQTNQAIARDKLIVR